MWACTLWRPFWWAAPTSRRPTTSMLSWACFCSTPCLLWRLWLPPSWWATPPFPSISGCSSPTASLPCPWLCMPGSPPARRKPHKSIYKSSPRTVFGPRVFSCRPDGAGISQGELFSGRRSPRHCSSGRIPAGTGWRRCSGNRSADPEPWRGQCRRRGCCPP